MTGKSLAVLAAIAIVLVPAAVVAQPMPMPVQRAAGPAAGPRGPGMEILVAAAALVVVASELAYKH